MDSSGTVFQDTQAMQVMTAALHCIPTLELLASQVNTYMRATEGGSRTRVLLWNKIKKSIKRNRRPASRCASCRIWGRRCGSSSRESVDVGGRARSQQRLQWGGWLRARGAQPPRRRPHARRGSEQKGVVAGRWPGGALPARGTTIQDGVSCVS
jgi:hypothetical protein